VSHPDLDPLFRGDPDAWDAFVDDTSGLIVAAVRQACTRGGGAPADTTIDDIVQDVFVKLVKDDFRLLRTYDSSRAALSTWLTLVARSTAIDRLRRRRHPMLPLEHDDGPLDTDESAPSRDDIDLPLHILSERQRLVLRLLFDDNRSVTEVAAMLHVDEQTVRSTKHKALSRLRAHFDAAPVRKSGESGAS